MMMTHYVSFHIENPSPDLRICKNLFVVLIMDSSLRQALIIGLLAIAAMEPCAAFIPNKLAFSTTPTKESVKNDLYFGSSVMATKTVLSMGVLEDFVTKSDEKTRKADNDKFLGEVQKRVERINALEPSIEDLGDDEIQAKTEEFKARLKKGEDINGPLLEEAYAVVREAAW
jgi:hypothetical protein